MTANGDGKDGADVLPFRGGRKRGGGRKAAPPPPPVEEAAPSLAQQVARLAARGLDEAEIRVRLELPEALDAERERTLAEAFRRGQLLGRAQIKEAQYEAALQGRVTAQTRVLARLGEWPGEEGGEAGGAAEDVEVVRRILPDTPPAD